MQWFLCGGILSVVAEVHERKCESQHGHEMSGVSRVSRVGSGKRGKRQRTCGEFPVIRKSTGFRCRIFTLGGGGSGECCRCEATEADYHLIWIRWAWLGMKKKLENCFQHRHSQHRQRRNQEISQRHFIIITLIIIFWLLIITVFFVACNNNSRAVPWKATRSHGQRCLCLAP